VRTEVEHHLFLSASKDHGVGEGAATRDNLDRASTSIVESTPCEEPAVGIPGPVCDGAVYDRGPEPDKDHHRDQAAALGNATDDNGSGNTAELHLSSC